MKNVTLISDGLVYNSDPTFQQTDFFYHFPLWDLHSEENLELFMQKLELFLPFWDSKTIWTKQIYPSNVTVGWKSLKWERWYRLLWCALQILLQYIQQQEYSRVSFSHTE